MVSLKVYDRSGGEVGSLDVDLSAIAPAVNKQLLHDVVVMYQTNRRQGSHRTKSRAEVAGTTKKMYRQKGTGNARAGHRRSGVRRGGGHIFARRPRDYSYRLPRKAVRMATRMAIRSKLQDEQVVVVDDLSVDVPKTREVAALLKALKLSGVSTVIATDGNDTNVYKSARNIPGVDVLPISDLNALAVLAPERVLFTKAGLQGLVDRVTAG